MTSTTRSLSHRNHFEGSAYNPLSSVRPPTSVRLMNESEAQVKENLHAIQLGRLGSTSSSAPYPSIKNSTKDKVCCVDHTAARVDINTASVHWLTHAPKAAPGTLEWPATRVDHTVRLRNPQSVGLQHSSIHSSATSSNFPPTNTLTRHNRTSSMSSELDGMEFDAPPPYRRTPPPIDFDYAEELAERILPRPTSLRRSSTLCDFDCDESLGLRFDKYLPTPNDLLPVDRVKTPSTSTSQSRSRRPRLHIVIPNPPVLYGPPSPPRPVTALYFPRSDAGDICPTPADESYSHQDNGFTKGDSLYGVSYDNAIGGISTVGSLSSSARCSEYPDVHTPRSPPRLPRRAYIPLPSEETPNQPTHENSLEASFEMLRLHDESSGGLHTVRRHPIKEHDVQPHPVTNLPQVAGVGLLSPLPLVAPPTYQLEDLEEQISYCQDAMEKVHSSLSSSSMILQAEAHSLYTALVSVFSDLKREALRPPLDLELLTMAHGVEWRRKYERVILSLDRNLAQFMQLADEIGKRRSASRHLVTLKDKLGRYARKFEDIECRLKAFHNHISLLELRAEYQELAEAARAEVSAERMCRRDFKIATLDAKARRQALKEQIREKEEAAKTQLTSSRSRE